MPPKMCPFSKLKLYLSFCHKYLGSLPSFVMNAFHNTLLWLETNMMGMCASDVSKSRLSNLFQRIRTLTTMRSSIGPLLKENGLAESAISIHLFLVFGYLSVDSTFQSHELWPLNGAKHRCIALQVHPYKKCVYIYQAETHNRCENK